MVITLQEYTLSIRTQVIEVVVCGHTTLFGVLFVAFSLHVAPQVGPVRTHTVTLGAFEFSQGRFFLPRRFV